MADLSYLPALDVIERLTAKIVTIKPGQLLVLRTPAHVTREMYVELRQAAVALQEKLGLPDGSVVVVSADMDLSAADPPSWWREEARHG